MAIDPSARIHPMAVVEEGAEIGADVQIGPFSVVGPRVRLARGVQLKSQVCVSGDTQIGEDTVIFPFASIGEVPQDLKYAGEDTRLVVGARNRIRENVTMNAGTIQDEGVTRVGDDCLFMAGCHVAHDARVGNRVVVANFGAIAGHCVIEDEVILGGLSGIHQWVRVGKGAIVGAMSKVTNDVIPHGLVQGPRGDLDGLNLVGLKRRGVERADITALRAAFLTLKQGEGTFAERAERLGEDSDSPYVLDIVRFITGASDRSFLTPK